MCIQDYKIKYLEKPRYFDAYKILTKLHRYVCTPFSNQIFPIEESKERFITKDDLVGVSGFTSYDYDDVHVGKISVFTHRSDAEAHNHGRRFIVKVRCRCDSEYIFGTYGTLCEKMCLVDAVKVIEVCENGE